MKRFFFLLFVIPVFIGCDTNTDSFTSLFKSFDRQGMLSNIGNNIVITSYDSLYNQTQNFNNSLQSFKSLPNAINLANAQHAWKNMNASWRACEIYGFGPLDYLVLKPLIDNYYCNTTNIENNITNATIINQTYINGLPVSEKGIVASEYLLFGDVGQDPLTLLTADTQRVNYLIEISTNLLTKIDSVKNEWASTGNNYINTFIMSDGNNINSSLGKIINYEVMMLDEIKNMKLGKPLGKFDANTIPTEVESYYSKESLINIENNLTAIEKLFTGEGNVGIYALLDHIGIKDNNGVLLSDKLKQKFILVYTDINNVSFPLDQAVNSDFADCDILYNDVYGLMILVKVDVMNQLGLLLTFNDNDGD